eukprot:gene8316-862_t
MTEMWVAVCTDAPSPQTYLPLSWFATVPSSALQDETVSATHLNCTR